MKGPVHQPSNNRQTPNELISRERVCVSREGVFTKWAEGTRRTVGGIPTNRVVADTEISRLYNLSRNASRDIVAEDCNRGSLSYALSARRNKWSRLEERGVSQESGTLITGDPMSLRYDDVPMTGRPSEAECQGRESSDQRKARALITRKAILGTR